ncbi:hypothetical protein FDZ73_20195 [bacterium]|nr:MAG: hypothetical protein FDZ73_20195 [bacterium]
MDPAKRKIIETLTGIRSSKKNYYVELQQKIEEVTLRNRQLEIINRVAKSFNVDLPIERIIKCMVEKLKTVILLMIPAYLYWLTGNAKTWLVITGPVPVRPWPASRAISAGTLLKTSAV